PAKELVDLFQHGCLRTGIVRCRNAGIRFLSTIAGHAGLAVRQLFEFFFEKQMEKIAIRISGIAGLMRKPFQPEFIVKLETAEIPWPQPEDTEQDMRRRLLLQ